MKYSRWLALAVLAPFLAACNPNPNAAPPPSLPNRAREVPHALPPPPPSKDPLRPEVILARLHTLDQQMIDASKQAKKSAHNRRVRSLAAEILNARERADEHLVQESKRLSVPLQDPATLGLPPADQSALDADRQAFASIDGKKGTQLDQAYLSAVDRALQGELALLSQVDAKATDPNLKALSTNLEPGLSARKEAAERELRAAEGTKTAG